MLVRVQLLLPRLKFLLLRLQLLVNQHQPKHILLRYLPARRLVKGPLVNPLQAQELVVLLTPTTRPIMKPTSLALLR